jgi:hypothetical protein
VRLAPSHGYTAEELDRIEAETGVMFPPVLREWWRLAGKHPLVAEIGAHRAPAPADLVMIDAAVCQHADAPLRLSSAIGDGSVHANDVTAGPVRTNGTDTIFHASNYVFRTVEAFARFKAHVEPTGGICIGVETADPALRLYETDRKGIFHDAQTALWQRIEVEKRHPATGRTMRAWAWRQLA